MNKPPVLHLPLRRSTPAADRGYLAWKRGVDVAFCLVAIPLMLPVLAACAAAVRLSGPGPILFVQQRTGRGGKRFSMLKFRTMVADAAQQRETLKGELGLAGPDFKLRDDPRVTRVGAFLRRSSLDEIPQVWNILRGDMTLVGPRPTSFAPDTYDLWHTERLEVAPGLTGLWQITERGELDFDERVRLDISYVRHRSLALDAKILLRTLPAVMRQRGAY